jgi:hypothetical protein
MLLSQIRTVEFEFWIADRIVYMQHLFIWTGCLYAQILCSASWHLIPVFAAHEADNSPARGNDKVLLYLSACRHSCRVAGHWMQRLWKYREASYIRAHIQLESCLCTKVIRIDRWTDWENRRLITSAGGRSTEARVPKGFFASFYAIVTVGLDPFTR